jgi:hypothetical protein
MVAFPQRLAVRRSLVLEDKVSHSFSKSANEVLTVFELMRKILVRFWVPLTFCAQRTGPPVEESRVSRVGRGMTGSFRGGRSDIESVEAQPAAA